MGSDFKYFFPSRDKDFFKDFFKDFREVTPEEHEKWRLPGRAYLM